MNLKNLVHLFYIIPMLAMLITTPACIKTYNIVKTESPQGKANGSRYVASETHRREAKVYNEWMTHAVFYTIPMFDDVREELSRLHCTRMGKDEDFYKSYLRRQLEENKYWFTFHVLADVRSENHDILSDKDSEWSFYIEKLDGTKILPQVVEMIDLNPEELAMWGPTYTNFKTSYIVKFPSKDFLAKKDVKSEDKIIDKEVVSSTEKDTSEYADSENSCPQVKKETVLDDSIPFKLVVSSVDRKCFMYWGEHPELEKAKSREKEARVIIQKSRIKNTEHYDNFYWVRSPGF